MAPSGGIRASLAALPHGFELRVTLEGIALEFGPGVEGWKAFQDAVVREKAQVQERGEVWVAVRRRI